MTIKRFMSLLAMALLWTGSQIPVYLYGMPLPISIRHVDTVLMTDEQAVSPLTSIKTLEVWTDGFGLWVAPLNILDFQIS